ncbi:MAG: TlpA family protein disulfide reductase [Saprospiraceae bacterium]|nr:TlpA family protein disulfide reductase [Bacteroidia bacterium]NNL90928.1 TlpA family protein disulfide reductase [Saprospiraceae bacterium]
MRSFGLVLFVIFLISCSSEKVKTENVIINGQIKGYDGSQLFVSNPVNGVGHLTFYDSVQVNQDGSFAVNLELSKASFINVVIPTRLNERMIIEPGRSYQIEIALSPTSVVLKVLDDSKPLQDILGRFNNPRYVSMGMPPLNSAMKRQDISDLFDNAKASELKMLDSPNLKISDDAKELLTIDRNCFYAARKAEVSWRRSRRRPVIDQDTKDLWMDAVDQDQIIAGADRSPWYGHYLKALFRSKLYLAENYDSKNESIYDVGPDRHAHYYDGINKYLPDGLKESALATYIHQESNKSQYEKSLVDISKQFNSKYSKSNFSKYLQPNIDKIQKYFAVIEADFADGINFISNPNSVNSLKELSQLFKGKKLYLDVWASWCGPCKREFQFNTNLKKLLKEQDVQVVYISTDKATDVEKWHRNIKQYELIGYHINANQRLKVDIQNHYGSGLRIPYYLLLNGNGDVVKNHASRPSQIAKLRAEIDAVF